jgi:hypothetical protein
MWNVKAKVIPVIIGGLGLFKITQKIREQHTGKS